MVEHPGSKFRLLAACAFKQAGNKDEYVDTLCICKGLNSVCTFLDKSVVNDLEPLW